MKKMIISSGILTICFISAPYFLINIKVKTADIQDNNDTEIIETINKDDIEYYNNMYDNIYYYIEDGIEDNIESIEDNIEDNIELQESIESELENSMEDEETESLYSNID